MFSCIMHTIAIFLNIFQYGRPLLIFVNGKLFDRKINFLQESAIWTFNYSDIFQ